MKLRLFARYYRYAFLYFLLLQLVNSTYSVLSSTEMGTALLNNSLLILSIVLHIGALVLMFFFVKKNKAADLWTSTKHVLKKRWGVYGLLVFLMSKIGQNSIVGAGDWSYFFIYDLYDAHPSTPLLFCNNMVHGLLSSISALIFFVLITFLCDVVSTAKIVASTGKPSSMMYKYTKGQILT